MSDYQRIKSILDYLNLSANKLSKLIGLPSPQIFYDIKAGRCGISKDLAKKIQDKFININASWLLTGTGDMTFDNYVDSSIPAAAQVASNTTNQKLVPVVDIDYVGNNFFSGNYEMQKDESLLRVPFLNSINGDLAIQQYGDSMAPVIPAGALMLIRKVDNWKEYLGYGNDFIIILIDGRRLTKNILKNETDPESSFVLRSYNPEIGDEILDRRMIREIWKIITVLNPKGW